MKFSGKVWSDDHGTTSLHFGSIRVNRAMPDANFFVINITRKRPDRFAWMHHSFCIIVCYRAVRSAILATAGLLVCSGLRKTHLFGNRMCIGRSRSSKVIDLGTNRKGVCDFLLVINSNFGPILHRFWDMASYWQKIANFSYPTLVWRPHGATRQNFRMKLSAQKLEWWSYCTVKIAWS